MVLLYGVLFGNVLYNTILILYLLKVHLKGCYLCLRNTFKA